MKNTIQAALFLIFLMTSLVSAEDTGKIAVAAEGNTPAAGVSGMAARSPYFLIFDRAGALLETLENPYKTAQRGAGASVVPFLAEKGVTLVVAGNFGPKMIRTMQSRGMESLEFQGSTEAAVTKILEGSK